MGEIAGRTAASGEESGERRAPPGTHRRVSVAGAVAAIAAAAAVRLLYGKLQLERRRRPRIVPAGQPLRKTGPRQISVLTWSLPAAPNVDALVKSLENTEADIICLQGPFLKTYNELVGVFMPSRICGSPIVLPRDLEVLLMLCRWPAVADRLEKCGYVGILHQISTEDAIACLWQGQRYRLTQRRDINRALRISLQSMSKGRSSSWSPCLHLLILDLEAHPLLGACRLKQLDDALRRFAADPDVLGAATSNSSIIILGDLGSAAGAAPHRLLKSGRLDAFWTEADLPQVWIV